MQEKVKKDTLSVLFGREGISKLTFSPGAARLLRSLRLGERAEKLTSALRRIIEKWLFMVNILTEKESMRQRDFLPILDVTILILSILYSLSEFESLTR